MEFYKNFFSDYKDGLSKIEVCDVTLRDGEQTPGVSFTREEKIDIARKLDEVGVDVIEAGFPIVSKEEAKIVREIANLGLCAKTCALSRATKCDIDCVASCDINIVAIVFGTSDIHLKYKYKATRQEAIEKATSALDYAKEYGLTVRFAAEDATRTDLDFLKEYFLAGEKHGADMFSIADTVGILSPDAMRFLVEEIKKVSDVPICIHCHDDLGMALANTLSGAQAGAKQLHATVNGIGERAGNTPLEELLTALYVQYGVNSYDLTLIHELSEMVKNYSGIDISKNKAVVGRHAFAHESGIHVAAVLEEPMTYEPFSPELVGSEREFVLGKHTGKKGLRYMLEKEGHDIGDMELDSILENIKNKASVNKFISQKELKSLVFEKI